ncbi:MAG: hypothetical protein K940chlam9_00592 [Chlamydiae bacterium]|nr:hypothetical protein [Chlamydiota bacterium]
MTKRRFGDLEQSILHVMRSKERWNVREVQEALGGEDKYTTIMTVMGRLAEKKLLKRERVGLRYEYWLAQDQESSRSLLKRAFSRLFGMKTADVVTYLIEQADDLSLEDLEEVEKLIAKAKKRRSHE